MRRHFGRFLFGYLKAWKRLTDETRITLRTFRPVMWFEDKTGLQTRTGGVLGAVPSAAV